MQMVDAGSTAICDFWYVRELGAIAEPLDDGSGRSEKRRIGGRLHAALKLWRRSHGRLAIPNWYQYGPLYVLLTWLSRDRNIVLVEFIDIRLDGKPAILRRVYDLFVCLLLAPAMRATLQAVQVMSAHEAEAFVRRYGVDPSRVHFVPWPLLGWGKMTTALPAPPSPTLPYVFSSGRTGCDWETLFAAAIGSAWPLRVVCSGKDLPRVQALNRNGRAEILSDIPLAEHDALLRSAAVYALVLLDQDKSAGQVRLGTCVSLNVPVVATSVKGLEGYLIDGVTGQAVPPGDVARLRHAIDALMTTPVERADLAARAAAHGSNYNKAVYFKMLHDLIAQTAGSRIVKE